MSCAKLSDRFGVISQTVSLIPGDQGLLRFLRVLGATLELSLHNAGRLSRERIRERETPDRNQDGTAKGGNGSRDPLPVGLRDEGDGGGSNETPRGRQHKNHRRIS
jgi:hypothetical protein